MFNTMFLIFYILISILLIVIILLQVGKGASMSNLFGGGSSDAMFSGAGGDVFMKKLTIGFAAAFIITSLVLTIVSSRQPMKTVMDKVPQTPQQQVPQGGETEPTAPAVQEEKKAPPPSEQKMPVQTEQQPAKGAEEPFKVQ